MEAAESNESRTLVHSHKSRPNNTGKTSSISLCPHGQTRVRPTIPSVHSPECQAKRLEHQKPHRCPFALLFFMVT